jgi:hypothetical protein
MNEINWIDLLIKVVLFLIASYFIFYKSWLKYLGKEIAQLSTRKQLPELEEKVKKDFNEKLESYKSKLNEELAIKIEPIKSELAKNNITHQIEYGYLHQERAKVILELYRKLQELHSAMMNWTATLQPIIEDAKKESEERTIRVNKAIADFKNYYILNKLFFSETFCKYIDELFKEYWDKGWEFGYSKSRIESGQITEEYFKHYSDEMSKVSKELRETIPQKLQEMESRFRKVLKVEEDEAAKD